MTTKNMNNIKIEIKRTLIRDNLYKKITKTEGLPAKIWDLTIHQDFNNNVYFSDGKKVCRVNVPVVTESKPKRMNRTVGIGNYDYEQFLNECVDAISNFFAVGEMD